MTDITLCLGNKVLNELDTQCKTCIRFTKYNQGEHNEYWQSYMMSPITKLNEICDSKLKK